ncbi:MAG: GNAT family N-acetyltransferase [Cytophagales bacterium]|nr:GNAT family N-acetyltransferase [Armatimonadota bacterium]
MSHEWSRGDEYEISDDRARVDDDRVTAFIGGTYWAKGVPRAVMVRALDHSLVFGIYHATLGQVGLARVVTDRATFAYLCDVYLAPKHRGRGLGKWLVEVIAAHPDLQGLRRWMLLTADAHSLYEKIGFRRIEAADRYMERHFPDIYQKENP